MQRREGNAPFARVHTRMAVAAAPLVATVALDCGVTFDAGAALESEVEVLRDASLLIGAVAFWWLCIMPTLRRGLHTNTRFKLRMLVERKSRMPSAANAVSILSAAVTLVAVIAMVR